MPYFWLRMPYGDGPNTVSESTVSNTEQSEFFGGLTEFRGANSVSSFQPIICVQTRTHRVSRRSKACVAFDGFGGVGGFDGSGGSSHTQWKQTIVLEK